MSITTDSESFAPGQHAVVFAFDGLPVRSLGCYGNQTNPTPAFDLFASGAVVFDQHFATQLGTAALDSPVWTECERDASGQQSAVDDNCWSKELRNAGIEIHEFNIDLGGRQKAELEQCLSAVAANVKQQTTSTLTWVRIVGVAANITLQQNAADIDEIWGQTICNIANIVTKVGGMIAVIAARGECLPDDDNTTKENTVREAIFHTPLIIQLPNCDQGTRRRQLVQTADLISTLHDWYGLSFPTVATEKSLSPLVTSYSADAIHDYAFWQADLMTSAIRSTDFLLTRTVEVDESNNADISDATVRLYIKPDDFFDVHDVANQYPTVVSEMLQLLPSIL